MRPSAREHGSVTTELVLLTPLLLVLLGFVVMTGRLGEVDATVDNAAQQAARAGSLVGSASAAHAQAVTTAGANLDAAGLACQPRSIEVDTSRFAADGDVAVAVTCTVQLSDVAFAGLPGQRTVQARAVEVIDRHRGEGR
jgi:Flp pilus assembly protein TadG